MTCSEFLSYQHVFAYLYMNGFYTALRAFLVVHCLSRIRYDCILEIENLLSQFE